MPYIKPENREGFAITAVPDNEGELNYAITFLLKKYMEYHQPLSYKVINDILGALEGAKQEFYRRVASKYEDQKISENGDVY